MEPLMILPYGLILLGALIGFRSIRSRCPGLSLRMKIGLWALFILLPFLIQRIMISDVVAGNPWGNIRPPVAWLMLTFHAQFDTAYSLEVTILATVGVMAGMILSWVIARRVTGSREHREDI